MRGFSPSKTRSADPIDYRNDRAEGERFGSRNTNDWKNFCHYNNAVYMGGMSASQKHGKGLLLHDDGASVITEYYHDALAGHNIIFRENSITSIAFKNNIEYDIAYKVGKYIIKIPFSDSSHTANGAGFLIDYENTKMFQLVFENGVVVEKILHLNRKNNEDVFKRNAITKMIGVKHEQAFQLTFEKPQNMHVKYDQNMLTIGYYNSNGDIHGLAFKANAQNAEVSGLKSLHLKPIERGYYKNSNLQTFGEKFFSNGNKYVGQFQEGEYNGQGILLCPQEMKWVYGIFVDGKLNQVIDSNNERHTKNDFEMWVDSLWNIHNRYKERWIDLNIELPDELYLYRILKEANETRVTDVDPDRQESQKEGKNNLTKIQHQFLQGFPGDAKRSYVDQQLDRHYTNRTVYEKRIYENNPNPQDRRPRKQELQYRQNHYESSPQKEVNYKARDYPLEGPSDLYRNGKNREPIDYRKRAPIKQQYDDYPKKYKTNAYEQPRRSRFRYYNDINSRDIDEQPLDGIYRRTYFESLQRQRQRLRRLEDNDKDYLRNLRHELAKSPINRNYYDSPSRYDPIRYNGKIAHKNYSSYKNQDDPYDRVRPQTPINKISPSKYYDEVDNINNSRVSPLRPSRNLPYRSPVGSAKQPINNRSFVENNYKYWK